MDVQTEPSSLPFNSDFGFSNFDHEAEPGTEELLRTNPNEVAVKYAAWNFYGLVAFDGEKFLVEVWVHGLCQEILEVEEFDDIIPTTSDKYGWE